MYASLHNLTEYSIQSGLMSIEELVENTKSLGMSALAITDRNSISGAIRFYEACRKVGIKPILGCMFDYVEDIIKKENDERRYPLVLLAKNMDGWNNLLHLNSIAHQNNFNNNPRIDWSLLSEHHHGLICMITCIMGHIPQLIIADKPEEADLEIRKFHELFGDDLFLEIMRHSMGGDAGAWQHKINNFFIDCSQKNNISLVATNGVHFLRQEDAGMYRVWLRIQKNSTPNNTVIACDTDQAYLKSPDEMVKLFADIPEAIENTAIIADRCNLELILNPPLLPVFDDCDSPTPESNHRTLLRLVQEGLQTKLLPYLKAKGYDIRAYQRRLQDELSIVQAQGYSGYFLMAHDCTTWAMEQDIKVGPSRGTAGASLLLFTIGVTNVDPIKHNLYLDEFLAKGMELVPDIELTFSTCSRIEIIHYLEMRYSNSAVGLTSEFGKMGLRTAFKKIGKALGFKPTQIDWIAKTIPNQGDNNKALVILDKIVQENYELRMLFESTPKYRYLLEHLTGIINKCSIHSSGIYISKTPIVELTPINRDKKTRLPIVPFDFHDVGKIGAVKFAISGFETLSIVDDCIRMIKERHGTAIDWNEISQIDEKACECLSSKMRVGYAQNKVEAIADAVITCRLDYLKANYPLEFFTASINSALTGNRKQYPSYIEESKKLGFIFIPPDINRSAAGMIPVGDSSMLCGLRTIKKVGKGVLQEILTKRPYESMADFYERKNNNIVNRGVMENLIDSGVFSEFGTKEDVRRQYYSLLSGGRPEINIKIISAEEPDIFGLYLIEHPIEKIKKKLSGAYSTISELQNTLDGKKEIIASIRKIKPKVNRNGDPVAFVTVKDQTGQIELMMMADAYAIFGMILEKNAICKIGVAKSNHHNWHMEYLEIMESIAA